MNIHPTAIISQKAELAADVKIGAYSIIGDDVFIDSGTEIAPHVVIEGPTRIGKDNRIFQFASLGAMPQDKKYQGEKTWLEIGDRNTIREFVTFNRGTAQDAGVTKIGNDNWIMAYVHLAHDCVVGNHTVFANNASLAGHVHIGDHVVLGGYALVYQFVHIGDYAMVAFSAGVKQNVPPFSTVAGMPAKAAGINLEGLKRHQFAKQDIQAIKQAFHHLYQENLLLQEAREKVAQLAIDFPIVNVLSHFLTNTGKRGLIR